MPEIPVFNDGQIESLAKVLGECGSGSEISRVFSERGLEDHSNDSTKWKRLHSVFLDAQRRYSCANRIVDFIQAFLSPVRFVGHADTYEGHRQAVNTVLAFSGLELGADGQMRHRGAAASVEHKGFAQLLKGCFAAVRNPLAHEPKLLWQGEEDAADYLSLISLLHRKLDGAVGTGVG